MKIELVTCDSGDWEVLKVDDEVYTSGHRIDNYIFLELLQDCGNEIIETNITDEEMEKEY